MTRALFIHVPRTGGNTMRYMYREHIHVYSHDTVEQVKMRFSQTWDQHWKFGFVRNPWDRMVSLYFNSRYSRHEHIPTGLGQLQQDFHWWLHRPRITRKGYEWIHQQSPANMLCIDGEVAVDEVFEFDAVEGLPFPRFHEFVMDDGVGLPIDQNLHAMSKIVRCHVCHAASS